MTQTLPGARPRVLFWALFGGLSATAYLLVFVDNSATMAEDGAIVMRHLQQAARGASGTYLAETRPDVIVFHAYDTPIVQRLSQQDVTWDGMVATLHRYAACHGYTLAAAGFAKELKLRNLDVGL